MDFSSLGLNQILQKAVRELGYVQPTPVQVEAIPAILSGKDLMAGAQTGTGKTAAFALPIIHQLTGRQSDDAGLPANKPVRALILVPTRELAQQVYASFSKYAKNSSLDIALVYGGVSIKAQVDSLAAGVDIIVATPGRLLDLLLQGAVKLDQLQSLVFDEADRMLDMGFMEEIHRILKFIPAKHQTLLFSATFDTQIINLSKAMLTDPELIEVDERNTTANLVEQTVYNVDVERKREVVSYLIGSKNWHQVLIFVRTKKDADLLSKEMCKDGIKTQSIHGDKSQGARTRVLEEFKEGKIRALVATDVAARGLDIHELQYVINYELPYNAEDYIHRIGRTGRAGSAGLAISLLSPEENWLLEEIEAILDTRLPQQWLPGYEPDMTREAPVSKKNSRAAQKRRAKERAFGKVPGKKKPRRKH